MAPISIQYYSCYGLARVFVSNYINDVLAEKPRNIHTDLIDLYFATLKQYAPNVSIEDKNVILCEAMLAQKSTLCLLPLICVVRENI